MDHVHDFQSSLDDFLVLQLKYVRLNLVAQRVWKAAVVDALKHCKHTKIYKTHDSQQDIKNTQPQLQTWKVSNR